MRSNVKRRFVIGGAGLALLAGAGGTYAATQDSGDRERDAFLDETAERLDVSPEKLKSAMRGAFEERLDAAVKAGRLTREQADEIKRRAREHGGLPPFGGPPHPRHRGGPPGFEAAARYLGLSRARLHERLHDGRSLAQVARERGKSVDGLKQAMRKEAESRLEQAVRDKRLTEAQKDRMLRNLDRHIDDIVNGRHPRGPRFERRMGPGGGPPGMGPGHGPGGPGFGPPPA